MSLQPVSRVLRLAALLLLPALAASAEVDPRAAADAAYQAERWGEASEAYRRLAAEQGDGQAWYRLAVSLRRLGRYAEALEALDQARKAGLPPPYSAVEQAKIQLGQQQPDLALDTLEQAVAAGFSNPGTLEDDEELAPLKSEPRFNAVLERARANQYPCEQPPEFHQFDFWVGEWDVHTAQGQLAGTNAISAEQHGCVLVERWQSAGGGAGMSVNYYDPRSSRWVQHWLSEDGTLIDIAGGIDATGAMVLTGEVHYIASGQTAPFRGTWTPLEDGRVRQFFEQSNDGGTTWTPWFDGYYSRRNSD